MKRLVGIFLLTLLMMFAAVTFAAEMGVQVIGGPATEAELVSLDDIKIGVDITIDDYGVLTPLAYTVQDTLPKAEVYDWYRSGTEAEFAVLKIDILNMSMREKSFLEDVEVKVVYDDRYEYGGWAYQFDYNRSAESAIKKDDAFPIGPMYQGHYCFGATLPNAVFNAKEPLRMVVTIDGHEITYNIRK